MWSLSSRYWYSVVAVSMLSVLAIRWMGTSVQPLVSSLHLCRAPVWLAPWKFDVDWSLMAPTRVRLPSRLLMISTVYPKWLWSFPLNITGNDVSRLPDAATSIQHVNTATQHTIVANLPLTSGGGDLFRFRRPFR
uniref:Putative secreted protein n=1 Tax=Ixodes ricinus TaxID=34613 RepID=A0A6B0USM6_IXORI